MKVIDAKNVKELLTSLAIVPNVITEKWLNEHTVKAIPIEWLLEQSRKLPLTSEKGMYIDEILEDWEAEND